jgi:hypothetical protein
VNAARWPPDENPVIPIKVVSMPNLLPLALINLKAILFQIVAKKGASIDHHDRREGRITRIRQMDIHTMIYHGIPGIIHIFPGFRSHLS